MCGKGKGRERIILPQHNAIMKSTGEDGEKVRWGKLRVGGKIVLVQERSILERWLIDLPRSFFNPFI